MATTPRQQYSRAEVAKHNTAEDAWVIIDNLVYDVSKFAELHPGGTNLLLEFAGNDATEAFWEVHRSEVLLKYQKLVIGEIEKSERKPMEGPDLAKLVGQISKVPFGESSFWQGLPSLYYNDTHKAFRAALRKFIDTELAPIAASYDDMDKDPPKELIKKVGAFGILAARLGPGKHLPKVLPGNLDSSKFDYFHELIAHEEIARLCCPGFTDGLATGLVIGLPPLINFASSDLRDRIVPPCISGEKTICLAISEPFAGSDVANIRCTAKKSPCGQFYIVNGVKKWITQGQNSDYFTTAVRTGGPGISGISLLLIERGEGVETKKIKTSYSAAAGTTYIIFENAKVPVTNLIGKENEGFKCIMSNFNHERWFIVCSINTFSRRITEESFKWAHQRKVFGKPLIEQPVIRQKLAFMISRVEAVGNWLENLTYQMQHIPPAEDIKIAGPIALLKQLCTRVAYEVSDNACQIFGGRSITRTGMGQMVERVQRSIKFGAILGGSEEIMSDLAIRMAMRAFPKTAKL
jgi:alkylation response protein AidB-like acyl-CoA dehydrogenase/predicted heme/steroid binding protein